ncbi:little elongation complex subunit 1 [Hyperolius riggenbachi]|uniref:little elongation complex subunit 1 n=1 Tax=Hyperolius riggenbachi TaxID=752182 RepID=UPI0035A26686
MMPGETHSKVAGTASETSGSCQNCTSLQQNLNEYIAALIALKQKIIDSDHLLAEYQQKCDDLQYAERENETLRCQLEQILQKMSPQEKKEEELASLKAELAEKTSALKIFQQSQLEYIRIKEECERGDLVKKKLEVKLNKMEEAAEKHVANVKQLQLEKKVIGKELKKIQKKLDVIQNEKTKKAMKNAQTQVINDNQVTKLDKKKIKLLLEDIWGCIESSTEHSDGGLMLANMSLPLQSNFSSDKPVPAATNRKSRETTNSVKGRLLKSFADYTQSHNLRKPSVLHQRLKSTLELFVPTPNDSADCRKFQRKPSTEEAVKELESNTVSEEMGGNISLPQDVKGICQISSDLESGIEELLEIMNWAKPLPHLLSPLRLSPLTTKNVFGEFTDSSDESPGDEIIVNKADYTENDGVDTDSLASQSRICLDSEGDDTVEVEAEMKGIEHSATITLSTAEHTSTEHIVDNISSQFGRKNSPEESTGLDPNLQAPDRTADSISNSEVHVLQPHTYESPTCSAQNKATLDKAMDADFSGRMEIDNVQISEEDGATSLAHDSPVHHSLEDSPLNNCEIPETMPGDGESAGTFPVDNLPNGGDSNVKLRVDMCADHTGRIVTNSDEGNMLLPVNSEMCTVDSNSYKPLTRQSEFEPPVHLLCNQSNSSTELADIETSENISLDVEITFDRKSTFSTKETIKASLNPDSSIAKEHSGSIAQSANSKTDKVVPESIQEQTEQKTCLLLEKELPLKMNAGGGQCGQKTKPEEKASGIEDSVEIMSVAAKHGLDTDENQTKAIPISLDSGIVDQEKLLFGDLHSNKSMCTSTDKLECKMVEKEYSDLQTEITAEKTKESKYDVFEKESTEKCHQLNENKICSSETVQLCSAITNLNDSQFNSDLQERLMPSGCNQQVYEEMVDPVTGSRDKTEKMKPDLSKDGTADREIHANLISASEKNDNHSFPSAVDDPPVEVIPFVLVPPVRQEEFKQMNVLSEMSKSNKISNEKDGNKGIGGVSLDTSDEDDHFPIRKVSYTKTIIRNPGNLIKCSESPKNIKSTYLNSELANTDKEEIIGLSQEDSVSKATSFVSSENDCKLSRIENDTIMEPRSSFSVDVNVDPEINNIDEYNSDGKETGSVTKCGKKDILAPETIQCDNNAGVNLHIETEPRKSLHSKYLIWSFERPDDSFDPRDFPGKQKLKTKLENAHGSSESSFDISIEAQEKSPEMNETYKVKHASSSYQSVIEENYQHRLPQSGKIPQHTQVGETVLATADTSTTSDNSPESISKVRSEMGPPLPPLLGPLLATPPKSTYPLSPILSSSSLSSLPSPLDGLISPLPRTPRPPLVSPLSDCRKQKSPGFTSPIEKASRRILSSPLQFCAATPKHALPVPGRLPPAASGNCATSVQENSVKILDTMYPELSARARTINILKGNVQLNRNLHGDCTNVPVSQITGFKSITSDSTAFIKTGCSSKTESNEDKLSSCESLQPSVSNTSLNKRTSNYFPMPRSAKRLRLESQSPVVESVKDCSITLAKNNAEVLNQIESCHVISDCELLPDVLKDSSVDEDIITGALKRIEHYGFDLFPVIRSHIFVGSIPKVPVMRNEEKEVIYEFSNSKKNLADHLLRCILKKIRTEKRSMASINLEALCRVYVGLCRQLGDIERARMLCYSILKEDFPDPEKLVLFIVSSWNDILSTHGVVSKVIHVVLKESAKEEIASCLSAYLNWEKSSPMSTSVLLSSILMAMQLHPDVKFQQSEKYGEDLTDGVWEYVFAVDLLCTQRKWVWTHDNMISKELWPLMDKWVKRKKGNPKVTFVPDIIVATVLRLVGYLCQMGLKEGFVTAVKNVAAVMIAFLQHANEEGVPWGVQLASAYMLCDIAPSDPAAIYKTLQAWKETARNDAPPAIICSMQEVEAMLSS